MPGCWDPSAPRGGGRGGPSLALSRVGSAPAAARGASYYSFFFCRCDDQTWNAISLDTTSLSALALIGVPIRTIRTRPRGKSISRHAPCRVSRVPVRGVVLVGGAHGAHAPHADTHSAPWRHVRYTSSLGHKHGALEQSRIHPAPHLFPAISSKSRSCACSENHVAAVACSLMHGISSHRSRVPHPGAWAPTLQHPAPFPVALT